MHSLCHTVTSPTHIVHHWHHQPLPWQDNWLQRMPATHASIYAMTTENNRLGMRNVKDKDDNGYTLGLETRRALGFCKLFSYLYFTILTIYRVINAMTMKMTSALQGLKTDTSRARIVCFFNSLYFTLLTCIYQETMLWRMGILAHPTSSMTREDEGQQVNDNSRGRGSTMTRESTQLDDEGGWLQRRGSLHVEPLLLWAFLYFFYILLF
jgi:hypothetical protein